MLSEKQFIECLPVEYYDYIESLLDISESWEYMLKQIHWESLQLDPGQIGQFSDKDWSKIIKSLYDYNDRLVKEYKKSPK